MAQPIIIIAAILLLAILATYAVLLLNKHFYPATPIATDTKPLFSSANNQSFDIAITHFQAFTEKAKITFMYRFVEALSPDEAKKLQKYLTKLHSL